MQDIVFQWPALFKEATARVEVPVHYRQPEFDHLWMVDKAPDQAFQNHFTRAPVVDALLLRGSGHCIDFHRQGCAFQLEQLAFAMRCSVAS